MKKKTVAIAALTSALICQPMNVFAGAAPDGKTNASQTLAAQNGAWENWVQKWNEIKNDWTYVSIAPGTDETEMNFAWNSYVGEKVSFTYGLKEDLSDGQNVEVSQTSGQEGYNANKVTLKNLEAGKTYYYQVSGKNIESFTTDDDTSDFSFIFVGDPQIGSSNEEKAKKPEDIAKDSFKIAQDESVRNDTFNWNDTLNKAIAKTNGKASFILSAGDQIQTNAQKVKDATVSEKEYTGFLSPDVLKSVPLASTVGNHDADNANYTYHFNPANLSQLGDNGTVGGDYYYTYGDALFIQLNTQDTNSTEHIEFIKETVNAHPECRWKIVTLHQDIYGSAEHSNEPEITNLRYELVPAFEEYDIDLVLTGHDHAYSRSKMLVGGEKANSYTDDEFDEQLEKDLDVGDSKEQLTVAPGNIKDDTTDEAERAYLDYLNSVMDADAVEKATEGKDVAINSEGILYLTAGSSSGSKYYDLVPRQQTYIANRWQEDVPTYTVIDVNETTLTINTYRTDNNEKIDSQFTLVKTADHTQLHELIEKAQGLDKEIYTEDSYNLLEQALNAAIAVEADETSTSQTLTNAYTVLQQAMSSLVKKEVNTDTTISQVQGENQKPVQSDENKDSEKSKAVNTGDTQTIILPLSLLAIAGIGVIVSSRKKKQGE